MGWVREGTCNRCGECCRTGNPLPHLEPQIPGACALLRLNKDGRHSCSNRRHPYYLRGCNVWPTIPEHIADKPGCSYRFRWVE